MTALKVITLSAVRVQYFHFFLRGYKRAEICLCYSELYKSYVLFLNKPVKRIPYCVFCLGLSGIIFKGYYSLQFGLGKYICHINQLLNYYYLDL